MSLESNTLVLGVGTLIAICTGTVAYYLLNKESENSPSKPMSQRLLSTDRPYIEDVLDTYAGLDGVINLALGSTYFKPPQQGLDSLKDLIDVVEVQKYGAILGLDELRSKLLKVWAEKGVNVDILDCIVTPGSAQAFFNIALTLCDHNQASGYTERVFIFVIIKQSRFDSINSGNCALFLLPQVSAKHDRK